MAFSVSGSDGTLNGVTPVTLVAAPGAGVERIVKTITVQNRDTAVVAFTLRKVSAGGTRQIWSGDLDPGDTFIWNDPIVLEATTSSITGVMGGAAATTNPDWTSSFGDIT